MSDEVLSSPAQSNAWQLYVSGRRRQRLAGFLAAVTLILAFAVLADGLLANMRSGGSFHLEMLAGTSEPLSGPLGAGPASPEDVVAFPIPKDAPLSFEFDGFFASYWFGTGMWRGRVHVSETAAAGTYEIAVGVAGQPSSSFQTYTITVAGSLRELSRQSPSFFRRTTGWNPFIFAACFLAVGLGTALGSFLLGMRCRGLMAELGIAEIFKVRPEGDLARVIAVTGKRVVDGKSFAVYDSAMNRLGKAVFDREKGGLTECLFVPAGRGLPRPGSFVAFWPPSPPGASPAPRGFLARLTGVRLPVPVREVPKESVPDEAPSATAGSAEEAGTAENDGSPGSQGEKR